MRDSNVKSVDMIKREGSISQIRKGGNIKIWSVPIIPSDVVLAMPWQRKSKLGGPVNEIWLQNMATYFRRMLFNALCE